jgi:hypothetical protein
VFIVKEVSLQTLLNIALCVFDSCKTEGGKDTERAKTQMSLHANNVKAPVGVIDSVSRAHKNCCVCNTVNVKLHHFLSERRVLPSQLLHTVRV